MMLGSNIRWKVQTRLFSQIEFTSDLILLPRDYYWSCRGQRKTVTRVGSEPRALGAFKCSLTDLPSGDNSEVQINKIYSM